MLSQCLWEHGVAFTDPGAWLGRPSSARLYKLFVRGRPGLAASYGRARDSRRAGILRIWYDAGFY
jgi:hypothetical protein